MKSWPSEPRSERLGCCLNLGERWSSRLVATAAVDRVSTTIWSGGAAAGLYLGTGLILAFLVHTHYPGALGLREWIRVVLSWPLIFFLRSEARRVTRSPRRARRLNPTCRVTACSCRTYRP